MFGQAIHFSDFVLVSGIPGTYYTEATFDHAGEALEVHLYKGGTKGHVWDNMTPRRRFMGPVSLGCLWEEPVTVCRAIMS